MTAEMRRDERGSGIMPEKGRRASNEKQAIRNELVIIPNKKDSLPDLSFLLPRNLWKDTSLLELDEKYLLREVTIKPIRKTNADSGEWIFDIRLSYMDRGRKDRAIHPRPFSERYTGSWDSFGYPLNKIIKKTQLKDQEPIEIWIERKNKPTTTTNAQDEIVIGYDGRLQRSEEIPANAYPTAAIIDGTDVASTPANFKNTSRERRVSNARMRSTNGKDKKESEDSHNPHREIITHNKSIFANIIGILGGARNSTEVVAPEKKPFKVTIPEKPAARTATHFIDLTVKLDPPGKDQPNPYLVEFRKTIAQACQETARDYFLKTCFPEGKPEDLNLEGSSLEQILNILESETDVTLESAIARAQEIIHAIPDSMVDKVILAAAEGPKKLNTVLTENMGVGLANTERYKKNPDLYIDARNGLNLTLSKQELKKIREDLQNQIIFGLCGDFVRFHIDDLPNLVNLEPAFAGISLKGIVTERVSRKVFLGFERPETQVHLTDITSKIQTALTKFIQDQIMANSDKEAAAYIPQFVRITTTGKRETFVPLVIQNWRKHRDTLSLADTKASAESLKRDISTILSFLSRSEFFTDFLDQQKAGALVKNTVKNIKILSYFPKARLTTDKDELVYDLKPLDTSFWNLVISFCDSTIAKNIYAQRNLDTYKATAQKIVKFGENGIHPFLQLERASRLKAEAFGINTAQATKGLEDLNAMVNQLLSPYFPYGPEKIPKPGSQFYNVQSDEFARIARILGMSPEQLSEHILSKELYHRMIIDHICNMAPPPVPLEKKGDLPVSTNVPTPPKPVASTLTPPTAPKPPGVPKPATPAPKTAPPVVEKNKSKLEIAVNQELATIIDKLTITETTNPNFAAAAFKTALVNTLNSTYKPLIEMAGHTNAENLIKDPRFKQMVDSKLQSATDKWKNIKNGTNGAGSKQATSQGRLSSEQVASIKNSPNGRNGKEIKNGNLSREQLVQQLMQIIEDLKIPADTPPEEFSLEVAFEDALNAAVSSNPALKAQLPRNDSDYFALYQLFSWDEQSDLENALKTKVSQWLSTYKVK